MTLWHSARRACLLWCLLLFGLPPFIPAASAASGEIRTLLPSQDTTITRLQPNRNHGEEPVLKIRALFRKRALVQFDQAAIAAAVGSGTLRSAKLRLTILESHHWGPEGREVTVHRMTQAWTEFGATWFCPDDRNLQNHAPDCDRWFMGVGGPAPFVPTPTARARHRNGQTGPVEWDVTPDVLQFLQQTAANVGWLLKADKEFRFGRVRYGSREGASPPELVLDIQRTDVLPAGFGLILGQVIDARTGASLAGTTVKALGTTSEVLSDPQGRFQLPAPAGERVAVYLTRGGYVDAKTFAGVEAGRESTVGTVRLQPFDGAPSMITPAGGTHTDSTGTVTVIFPGGAVSTTTEVTATVFPTAASFPVTLPEGQAFLAGVQFTPEHLAFPAGAPVTVRITNTLGIPAGTNVPFAFANHSDQDPEIVFFEPGMARVSADGRSIEAQLPHFSCVTFTLPVVKNRAPVVTQSPNQPVQSSPQKCCAPLGSRVGANDGTLFLDQVLPSTRVLGRSNPLTFTYSSGTVDPHPLIVTEARLDPIVTTLPEQVTWRLQGGALEEQRIFQPQPGTFRYAWSWEPLDRNGNLLPTGSHRVDVTLSNDYQATLATTNTFGGPPIQDLGIPVPGLNSERARPNARVVIHNRQQSPFGAGWGFQGVQRLHPQPDGSVVITEGDGAALTFQTSSLIYAAVDPPGFTAATPFGSLSALDSTTGELQFVFPELQTSPTRVLLSPAEDIVFVAADSGVIFVDTRTQEVLSQINTISFAQDLAVSPDGSTLFAVSSQPSALHIIDVPSRQIRFRLNLAGVGVSVALSPDGRLAYVGQGNTQEVAVIDTQTRGIVTTIGVQEGISSRAMVLTKDGRTLYVGTLTGVAVIDTTTNSLRTRLPLGHQALGLALTPAGRLFVTSHGTTVTIVDGGILQVTGTVTLPLSNLRGGTVSRDGQRVLVLGNDPISARVFQGFVFVLDATTGAILDQFPLPDGFATDAAFWEGDPNRPLAPPGDFSTLTRNDGGTPADPSDDTWVRRMKDGTEHLFSATGLHLETRDRNGNRTVHTYDGAGRLLSLTDPGGGVTTFGYAGGALAGVTDPGGRTTQFSIDGAGNLLTVTTPDGAVTQYSYDSRHRLVGRTDPRGAVTQYEYDGFGRLSRVVHPTGEERTLVPSDAQGLLNSVPPGSPASPIPATAPFAQLTDGLSRTTEIQTDPLGAATQTVDPLGRTTGIQRNGHGLPLRITRPDGAVITLSYDTVGNLLSSEQLDPFTGLFRTSFTYEPVFNQVTGITDPKGNRTTINYDAQGNPTHITDAMNNTTALAYDGRGLLTAVTDARGSITTFTYDGRGNLIATTDPLGNATSLNYDAAGNVVSSTDALGRTTSFVYDGMNRLIQVTDAAGGGTRYGYDGNGNLVEVTDAKGQATSFAYDPLNQLTQTTNPVGQSKTFAYDLGRNLTATTDAKGQTISFAYDAANQLIEKHLPTGEIVIFTYDLMGNLTSAQDADSAFTFRYDARGRLTRVDTAATAAQAASSLTYGYDFNGNRLQLNATIGNSGVSQIYTHDALNRLTRMTSGIGGIVNFTYDELSRRTGLARPNGVATTYSYDAASQLRSLVHAVGGAPFASFNYTYDPVGNRTAMTEGAGTNAYAYDALNRLTQSSHPQAGNPAESFTYDPVGNRTSAHLATGQVHDAGNRLLEDSNFTYTYDANGNLSSKTSKATGGLTRYTYDPENQLIGVEQFTVAGGATPVLSALYRYDALGRRIAKVVNGVSTRFVYDNEDIVGEVDAANAVTALYTHGPGIDEPLAIGRPTGTFLFHADGLGSITTLTNTSGAPVRSYTYDSFGRIVGQTGTVANFYTYTGRELDPESGLFYYRARYYDPTIGRFLQEDPLELFGQRNFYVYVRNNAVNLVDPKGLLASKSILKAIAPIVAGAPATAEELAWQVRGVEAGMGLVGFISQPLVPDQYIQKQIPGMGGATVGDALDLVTGYGGIRTIPFAAGTAKGTFGSASVTGAFAASRVFSGSLVALSFLGGYEVGTAINSLVLNNPRFYPCGNPVERILLNLFFVERPIVEIGPM